MARGATIVSTRYCMLLLPGDFYLPAEPRIEILLAQPLDEARAQCSPKTTVPVRLP
jgi:hypothetical protein